MTPGMNFGTDGPIVTGWWVNPKTGDKFNAVDSYFEDNNLLIKTSDGRLLNYNQIQNYIQTSDQKSAEDMSNRIKNSATKPVAEAVPQEILNELESPSKMESIIIPDDNIFGFGGQKSAPVENINSVTQTPMASSELAIIQRALKNKTKPTVTGMIDWKDFPKKEIEMLMEMMDVPFETIVDYYVNSVNVNDIINNIKNDLVIYINNLLGSKKDSTTALCTSQNTDNIEKHGSKQTTKKEAKKK